MVRLILFDIDGTLVRTGGAGTKAFARVFSTEFNAHHGLERLSLSGRTDFSIVREFFLFHNIPPTRENFDRFFERYVFWLDHILKESQTGICPGVLEFIHGLQALPEPPVIGLLTGNIRLGAEIKLRHLRLWDYFATGGFADDHEDRDRIAAAARARGRQLLRGELQDEQVVVVGDTPLDIRCGRSIGARVLAVATGGSTYEELEPHKPDWLVRDLRALTAEEVVLAG